jgi:hypothetical protein
VGFAVYGVGAGAVDPDGIGEGASVEPSVFGGFLFADFFLGAGVGDALVTAGAAVLVAVVPDCWQDAINAMPITATIRENRCFFIGYIYFAPRRVSGCLKPNELLEMLARHRAAVDTATSPARKAKPNNRVRYSQVDNIL